MSFLRAGSRLRAGGAPRPGPGPVSAGGSGPVSPGTAARHLTRARRPHRGPRPGLLRAPVPPRPTGLSPRVADGGRGRPLPAAHAHHNLTFRDWKTHLGIRGLRLEVDIAPHLERLLLALTVARPVRGPCGRGPRSGLRAGAKRPRLFRPSAATAGLRPADHGPCLASVAPARSTTGGGKPEKSQARKVS